MKIYYPSSHYNANYRGHLFPLLKAFIKSSLFSDKERMSVYDVSEKDYQFVDDPSIADHVILTMSWLYYVKTKQQEKAIEFIQNINAIGKTVWVNIPGDQYVKLPKRLKVKILVQQGYKSKLASNVYCYPVFIDDELDRYFNTKSIIPRAYSNNTTVSFCGHASGNLFAATKDVLKTVIKHILFRVQLTSYLPHKITSNVYKRSKLLDKIIKDNRIVSSIIKRKKYRNGVVRQDQKIADASSLEFFNSIKSSDFVFCYRGAGNFSLRLYQTLAMGRIPIFVNTDCILPLEKEINWKHNTIWVESEEIQLLTDKIVDFYNTLNNEELNNLFELNRNIWETQLRLGGFFRALFKNENV